MAPFLATVPLDPEKSSIASAVLLRDARCAIPGTSLAPAVTFPLAANIPETLLGLLDRGLILPQYLRRGLNRYVRGNRKSSGGEFSELRVEFNSKSYSSPGGEYVCPWERSSGDGHSPSDGKYAGPGGAFTDNAGSTPKIVGDFYFQGSRSL